MQCYHIFAFAGRVAVYDYIPDQLHYNAMERIENKVINRYISIIIIKNRALLWTP
jgi:hypothetical protein